VKRQLLVASMKCVFTSSSLPSATVMAKIHVASTVGKRSLGVHCCVPKFHVPDRGLLSADVTVQVSTSAPEKLARIQPRVAPEMMESLPAAPVLFEPRIEWDRGCAEAGFSSAPHSGPQPFVYESEPSHEPVQRQ